MSEICVIKMVLQAVSKRERKERKKEEEKEKLKSVKKRKQYTDVCWEKVQPLII